MIGILTEISTEIAIGCGLSDFWYEALQLAVEVQIRVMVLWVVVVVAWAPQTGRVRPRRYGVRLLPWQWEVLVQLRRAAGNCGIVWRRRLTLEYDCCWHSCRRSRRNVGRS